MNAMPSIVPLSPQQINPQAYGNLSTLANNYINGIGTGYGDNFVNNATNPVAQSMRRNYQNVTAPTISSNYSSRGLGNSSLAANAQGLAEGNVESDIGNLMSQFYTMNEAQKKNDINTGAGLSQNLLSGDVAQQNKQADTSLQIQNQTNQNQAYNQNRDAGLAGNMLQSGAQLLNPLGGALSSFGSAVGTNGIGSLFSGIGGAASQLGTSLNQNQLAQQLYNLYGTKANIAGS